MSPKAPTKGNLRFLVKRRPAGELVRRDDLGDSTTKKKGGGKDVCKKTRQNGPIPF